MTLKTSAFLTGAAAILLSVSPMALAQAADLTAPEGSQATAATEAAASTEASQGAFKFVQATADAGLKFLSNPSATMTEKKAQFRKLLDNSFDLDTIGRFALGRYWNSATPAQQRDYLTQFRRMVVDVYANRFGDYKGQKFETKSFRSISDTDTLVTSFIHPVGGGEDIQVDWRVRLKGGKYKIVDVLVAGVSMSVTQRSDFASVIQRGGGNIDVLIDHLKNGSTTASK